MKGRTVLALTLAVFSAIPVFAQNHVYSFNVPCDLLWLAATDTLNNSGLYQVVAMNDRDMTATYVVGNAFSGEQTNYAALAVAGNECRMNVQTAFRGLIHKDADDFRKRVAQSLSRIQDRPRQAPVGRDAPSGEWRGEKPQSDPEMMQQPPSAPPEMGNVPDSVQDQLNRVRAEINGAFGTNSGPGAHATENGVQVPGSQFGVADTNRNPAIDQSPLGQINSDRAQAGLPPLMDAQANDPVNFSKACQYDLGLLANECQQGLAPSCDIGTRIQNLCSNGANSSGQSSDPTCYAGWKYDSSPTLQYNYTTKTMEYRNIPRPVPCH